MAGTGYISTYLTWKTGTFRVTRLQSRVRARFQWDIAPIREHAWRTGGPKVPRRAREPPPRPERVRHSRVMIEKLEALIFTTVLTWLVTW